MADTHNKYLESKGLVHFCKDRNMYCLDIQALNEYLADNEEAGGLFVKPARHYQPKKDLSESKKQEFKKVFESLAQRRKIGNRS